jgi:hypothetical protein
MERKILKLILKRYDERFHAGFSWLRRGTCSELLRMQLPQKVRNFLKDER